MTDQDILDALDTLQERAAHRRRAHRPDAEKQAHHIAFRRPPDKKTAPAPDGPGARAEHREAVRSYR